MMKDLLLRSRQQDARSITSVSGVTSSGGVASSVRTILCRSRRRHHEEQQGHLASIAFKLGRRVGHKQLSWGWTEERKEKTRTYSGQAQESSEKREREEAGGGGSHRVQRVANRIRGWRREQKKNNEGGHVTSSYSIHPRPDEGACGGAASQQRAQRWNFSTSDRAVTRSASEFGTYLPLLLHAAKVSAIMRPSQWLLEPKFCVICVFLL